MPKVFISHSSVDKDFVDALVADLIQHEFEVWYDRFEMRVGDSVPEQIDRGIDGANYFVIVLSPSAIGSSWVREELNAALVKQVAAGGTFLLPVLYRDCEIPALLAHRNFADFRNEYKNGLNQLLATFEADKRAATTLSKPSLPVPWPDIEQDDREYLYLHSERFDKYFRMNCNLDWTADYSIDYIVETLKLPWRTDLPQLGMRWSFSYKIILKGNAIPLSETFRRMQTIVGDAIKLGISGTYEDLYQKELSQMWDGSKMYEIGGAMARDRMLRELIAARGTLTQDRVRVIANSCFKHV